MNYIDNLINERREDIIEESGVVKTIGVIFKGLFAILFGPYICILAFLVIISPFIFISNMTKNKSRKIEEDKLRNIIRRNPEFIKNFNKISQNITNIFIKSVDIDNKNYFTFLPITNYNDIFVNDKSEISCEIIRFNVMNIFKDVTGCNYIQDYEEKCGHNDPDSEPECKELKDLFKRIEYTINSINQELNSKYKGLRIEFSDDINYEWLFDSLGYYKSDEDAPTINIYCKTISSIDNMDENIQKEVKKTITTMKPIIERRMK